MIHGNWVPMDKALHAELKALGRPFSRVEAMFDYQCWLDIPEDKRPRRLEADWARLWEWSPGKVKRFLVNARRTSGERDANATRQKNYRAINKIDNNTNARRTSGECETNAGRTTTYHPTSYHPKSLKGRGVPLPPKFVVKPEVREYALALGLSASQVDEEFRLFCAKARALEWVRADWNATLMSWYENAAKKIADPARGFDPETDWAGVHVPGSGT